MPQARLLVLAVALGCFLWPAAAVPGEAPPGAPVAEAAAPSTAPVVIDGVVVLHVTGILALLPEERAGRIADRIEAVASDRGFSPQSLALVPTDMGISVMAGERTVVVATEGDAAAERMPMKALAAAWRDAVRGAIERYRSDRSARRLVRAALEAAAALGVFALAAAAFSWAWRRLGALLERSLRTRVALRIQSLKLLEAERFQKAARGALRAIHAAVILAGVVLTLELMLGRFPWTRQASARTLEVLVDPLRSIALGIVGYLPKLVFLAILAVVSRWLLKMVRLLFAAVDSGTISLGSFEREWAWPTYRIVRVAVIAFALVVAYPYLPGSGTDALKGVSLFAGVVLSLGSSSFVANVIAGYAMIYQRAFRVGDRVKIGGVLGDVRELRLQATRLRTPKNEDVVFPNSLVVSGQVVNYSAQARSRGLILHTAVGIGYETPWRQVEAMLLLAADRAEGFLKEPKPFVNHTQLGDFAVAYELNAYCDRPNHMDELYTALHRSVLDVFNEYGIQIMTPAYMSDPERPKLVPREQWYASPARGPEARAASGDGPRARST